MADNSFMPPAFREIFEKAVPPTLYHYTGQAGLLGIVENAELWATKIQYMNDTTEFGLALRLAREWLDAVISRTHHAAEKTTCATLRRSLDGIENIHIFAICFCEKGDLLSQWRGYAQGNYAYALGFDPERLIQIADKNDFRLCPCIYDEAVQRKIVDQAVADCVQKDLSFPSKANWGFHGPLADILFRCGTFFKDAAFAEEKEWRLVSPIVLYNDEKGEKIRFRVGGSTIVPYYPLSIRHEDGLPIPQVVVGPCPHMDLAKSAVTSLLMKHGNRAPLNGQQIALDSKVPFRNW